jgi:hypothetical protein
MKIRLFKYPCLLVSLAFLSCSSSPKGKNLMPEIKIMNDISAFGSYVTIPDSFIASCLWFVKPVGQISRTPGPIDYELYALVSLKSSKQQQSIMSSLPKLDTDEEGIPIPNAYADSLHIQGDNILGEKDGSTYLKVKESYNVSPLLHFPYKNGLGVFINSSFLIIAGTM